MQENQKLDVGWLWGVESLGFEFTRGQAAGGEREQKLGLTGFWGGKAWTGKEHMQENAHGGAGRSQVF